VDRIVLEFVNLFCTGIFPGIEFVVCYGVRASLNVLGAVGAAGYGSHLGGAHGICVLLDSRGVATACNSGQALVAK
jgi:hypothetical protein